MNPEKEELLKLLLENTEASHKKAAALLEAHPKLGEAIFRDYLSKSGLSPTPAPTASKESDNQQKSNKRKKLDDLNELVMAAAKEFCDFLRFALRNPNTPMPQIQPGGALDRLIKALPPQTRQALNTIIERSPQRPITPQFLQRLLVNQPNSNTAQMVVQQETAKHQPSTEFGGHQHVSSAAVDDARHRANLTVRAPRPEPSHTREEPSHSAHWPPKPAGTAPTRSGE